MIIIIYIWNIHLINQKTLNSLFGTLITSLCQKRNRLKLLSLLLNPLMQVLILLNTFKNRMNSTNKTKWSKISQVDYHHNDILYFWIFTHDDMSLSKNFFFYIYGTQIVFKVFETFQKHIILGMKYNYILGIFWLILSQ